MIHCAGKIRIGKSDSTMRPVTQNVARGRLAIDAKKTGLWIHIGRHFAQAVRGWAEADARA